MDTEVGREERGRGREKEKETEKGKKLQATFAK